VFSFTFLGTGTSVGVPQIGCSCKVCTSKDPRDRRRRCGAYVRSGETGFLIDTPPEMRLSCCEYGVSKVDAVVITHAHMDHVAGFDDVRRFNTLNGEVVACNPTDEGANGRTCRVKGKILPCYAMKETEEAMHRIFPYISAKGGEHGLYRPQIVFDNADVITIGDIRLERLPVEHGFPCCGYLLQHVDAVVPTASKRRDRQHSDAMGTIASTGFASVSPFNDAERTPRLQTSDSLAYISDCHVLPEETLAKIEGVDTLVLNCLRERPHPTHLSLEAALAYIGRIKPRRAYLTHLCHDFTHEEWLAKLPKGIEPAYDGLSIVEV